MLVRELMMAIVKVSLWGGEKMVLSYFLPRDHYCHCCEVK